jgi:serine/threonine protein kinase
MSNLIGQSIGRYHILEQLGVGGMAVVYKGLDTTLKRHVAIKLILPNNRRPEKIFIRFKREAHILARLSHFNILKIFDTGKHQNLPYLVMEYLPGGTLKERLGKPIPWQEAVRLLIPIGEALAYAHKEKVIHRDVKPSNILLTSNGQPMLTDFGIAKILLDNEEAADLTGVGMGIGTPAYMSPEQSQGKDVDARTDVYALGVVLYEMITGQKPYTANTPSSILLKQVTEPLPPPSSFVQNLPADVEKILIKALAKDPEDRYQNMSQFRSALETLLGQSGKQVGEKNSEDGCAPPEPTQPIKDTPLTGWRTLDIPSAENKKEDARQEPRANGYVWKQLDE